MGRGVAALAALIAAGSQLAAPGVAHAAPLGKKGSQGVYFAKKGDCVKAVPLLEDAELARHSPITAVALAGCYVALGELIRASELYHAVAGEERSRRWSRAEHKAQSEAAAQAEEIDARIPTIAFDPAEVYEGLEVKIDGHVVADPTAPKQVSPDVEHAIEARATGRKRFTRQLVLGEGERFVSPLRLDELRPDPPPEPPRFVPETWLGARFRGLIIPRWVMNAFGEGGTTLFVPGGGITLTKPMDDVEMVFSLGYASYALGATPFKPSGTPDTEYEMIESDLQALFATVDVTWDVPLDDDGDVSFRIGGGIGLGWAFAGDLRRTQAYPPAGAAADPYAWKKCRGPNDPYGTFRYCNQLDKDADHYDGYAEPGWFDGGSRPVIFPWLAVPQGGLTWKVSPRFAIDLEAGVTLSGVLTGIGWRVGF